MTVVNIVRSLQSVAKAVASCVGVRAEQSKERKTRYISNQTSSE